MQFLFPKFLFALLLVAVPLIIHLFNFRRFKKIYFTNVKFLKAISEETTSRSKLKHLLVLASRILAITSLVFVFAQPYIPSTVSKPVSGSRLLSVYIDNSFSMENLAREGSLLEIAKNKAREIALAYRPSDRFQLLTNDFEARHQRLINREEFLSWVDEVKPAPSVKKISEVMRRMKDVFNAYASEQKMFYVLTDGQQSQMDLEVCQPDSLTAVSLVLLRGQQASNVFIDSCWFSSPVLQAEKQAELNVRIINFSDAGISDLPLKLNIDGVQKSVAALALRPGEEQVVKLNFITGPAGWHQALLAINDHPVTFDDTWYFTFHVKQSLHLLHLFGNNATNYMKALFGKDDYIRLDELSASRMDYSALLTYNMIFISGLNEISSGLAAELRKYVNEGGSLAFFPDSAMDFISCNEFTRSLGCDSYASLQVMPNAVEKLSNESAVFSDVFEKKNRQELPVDLPVVQKFYSFNASGGGREIIMKMQDGSSFLSAFRSGKGSVYLFAVPLSSTFSNFPKHALFVPVLYKLALLSKKPQELFKIIGMSDEYILPETAPGGDDVYHLVNRNSGVDLVAGMRRTEGSTRIFWDQGIRQPGFYDLELKGKTAAVLAFNFNRLESRLTFLAPEELKHSAELAGFNNRFNIVLPEVKNLASFVQTEREGTPLWKYFVTLALLFVGIEILLLRFWK